MSGGQHNPTTRPTCEAPDRRARHRWCFARPAYLVGALPVAFRARGPLRDAGRVLLDAEMDVPVVADAGEAIEHGAIPARISDPYVRRVGRRHYACVASIVTDAPVDAQVFHDAPRSHDARVQVTVEVHRLAAST